MIWALQGSCSGRAGVRLPFISCPEQNLPRQKWEVCTNPRARLYHPPMNTRAHSVPTPPLTPIRILTVNWVVAFVDFRWNVPFH